MITMAPDCSEASLTSRKVPPSDPGWSATGVLSHESTGTMVPTILSISLSSSLESSEHFVNKSAKLTGACAMVFSDSAIFYLLSLWRGPFQNNSLMDPQSIFSHLVWLRAGLRERAR